MSPDDPFADDEAAPTKKHTKKKPVPPADVKKEKKPPLSSWAVGRPTKYSPAVLGRARRYIDDCRMDENQLPTIEELSIILGVTDETVVIWGKKHKEFLTTTRKLKALQRLRLMHQGRAKDRPIMEIFLLKAVHKVVEPNYLALRTEKGTKMEVTIGVQDSSGDASEQDLATD